MDIPWISHHITSYPQLVGSKLAPHVALCLLRREVARPAEVLWDDVANLDMLLNNNSWPTVSGKWGFPEMGGVPQNGCFTRENPIKMDDSGVPLFQETPKWWTVPMHLQSSLCFERAHGWCICAISMVPFYTYTGYSMDTLHASTVPIWRSDWTYSNTPDLYPWLIQLHFVPVLTCNQATHANMPQSLVTLYRMGIGMI